MNNLAPIYMTTYRRLSHVKRSVEALRNNPLSKESILNISSDGPMPGDEEQVYAVRDYLKTIDGFKEINLTLRDKNDRADNRRIKHELLDTFGKFILVEEDCETAPQFLSYMNAMLTRFKDEPDIFAVCGYTYPLKALRSLQPSLLKLPGFAAWGYGIWKEKWD